MHCRYCLQTGVDVPANRPADLGAFCAGFARKFKDAVFKRIVFWGGEPMLYWKTIREVIERFEILGIEPTDAYIITTNARRMTDDYVTFVNARPVWTVVSTHDWHFTPDQMDRIFRLDRFSMSVIIQHDNLNFMKLRERYYQLKYCYGVAPRLYLHFLRANDGCDPSCYMTKDDVDTLCRHLCNDVIPMAHQGDEWARWQCMQLLWARQKEVDKGFGGKCVRSDRLSIDLHGNIYECHHNFDATNIVGNLFKKTVLIVNSETKRINPDRFCATEQCQTCEIFSECRGGCYLSNTHDIDCYLAKRMHDVYSAMSALDLKGDRK